MKTSILLLSAVLLIGCDNMTGSERRRGSAFTLSEYLQTMSTVTVTYTATTDHRYEVKQGSLDNFNEKDIWFIRSYSFGNTDPSYALQWDDTKFSSRGCFALKEVGSNMLLESGCEDNSLVRGKVDNVSRTLNNIECLYRRSYGADADPMTYKVIDASMSVPYAVLDSMFDDSVRFIVRTFELSSIRLSYKSDELAYGTYSKKATLVDAGNSKADSNGTQLIITFRR